jgi:site-specific DNA-methyltransferase (adenine-specific)
MIEPRYQSDRVTLYCGDALAVLPEIASESIDMVLTSPPYDNMRGYSSDFDFPGIARELWRIIKPGGVMVWIVGDATIDGDETGTSFRQALHFKSIGFRLHDTMIYQKPGGGAVGSNYCYWQSFEYMFVFSKGRPKSIHLLKDKKNKRVGGMFQSGSISPKTGDRVNPTYGKTVGEYGYRDNIWSILPGNNGDDPTDHPAVFPEKLAGDHIVSWSDNGDIILDCFLGSGTTGKMAYQYNRRFIGIEIDPIYYTIAEKRIRAAESQLLLGI